MEMMLPNVADVDDAASRLQGVAYRTPTLRVEALDRLTGARLFLKCENLQRTGAFKFRGAYNCVSRLDPHAITGGVVAYSTGNHGQAIATVCRMLDIPATIVMPVDAPQTKIAKARAQGARIVLYDRNLERREEIAERLATEAAVAVVPPGDNRFVIAGQGTVVAEAFADCSGESFDFVLVPCGGGGLAAGTCLATELVGSRAQIWAVEPAGFDDTRRSLSSGRREANQQLAGSICDALLAPTPAALPFEINRKRLGGVAVVDDHEVRAAMRFAFRECRLVVEPGGAVALAWALANPSAVRGKSVLVVLSGGNVDEALFLDALSEAAVSKSERNS